MSPALRVSHLPVDLRPDELRTRSFLSAAMILWTHLSTCSLLHRLRRFLLRPTLLVSILLLPGAQAQQPPLSGSRTCSPQAGVITVWKIGSPYENGLPDKAISADLKLRTESLGCAIRVEVFPAVGFADQFFAAFEKHQEPDILVVENRGVILGVTMRSGKYIDLVHGGGIVRRTPAAIEGLASKEAIFRALEG